MKLTLPTVLLAASFCLTAHAKVTSTFTQTYPLTADGVIRIENVNGLVEITAWDKNEVSLVAEKNAPTDDDLQRLEMKIESKPDRLSIKTERKKKSMFDGNWRGEVTYRLSVPAHVVLEKIAVVNATIKITDVKGRVEIETVNGEVKVTGAESNGRFKTVNGTISVAYADVSAVKDIAIESVNGSCSLRLPANAPFRVEGHTVNGGVHCDSPVTVDKSGWGKFIAHVGEGGPSIDFHAVNGDLNVKTK
jgi:hypothetical protein